MKNSYKEIAEKLAGLDHIVILPHVNMDGDALGSSSALCIALKSMGKNAVIVTDEVIPANLDFLARNLIVSQPDFRPELAIMVDCCGMNRIPGREEIFEAAPVKAVIDHHGVTGEQPNFDFGRIEPDSAATGEMIELLIEAMNVEIDLPMAEGIFTAITTDTGNFQHANTTARTHEMAAQLHRVPGFNCKKISNLIYNRNSLRSIRLHSLVMSSIQLFGEDKVAVAAVTQEMLRETGCELSEAEGFVQDIMSVDGVEVGCLLKEAEPAVIRCSLRSRSHINVAEVAGALGGGGHVLAAGCRIRKPLDEAKSIITEKLVEQVEKDQ